MNTPTTETTIDTLVTKPVYEAPKVTNHAVSQIVQGTGSATPDSANPTGNLG